MRMFARKNKMLVSKGDEVIVINGKQKRTKGVVKKVLTKNGMVVVEGVNKMKKAVRIGQNNNEHYSIVERPIFASKVRVVKKKQDKAVRSKSKKD